MRCDVTHEPAHTLVLGCGNDLRGDDALGPMVIDRVASLLADRDDVTVEVCCGLTPELADTLSRVDRLIFVDCAAQGDPGVVQRTALMPQRNADIACVHLLDLPALLTWTQHLFGRAPSAIAFSVAGERFELSESLSPRVAAAMPELVDAVLAELGVASHA